MNVKIIDASNLQIEIEREIYSSEVVHKCFYWYSEKYSIDIKSQGNLYVINLSEISKEGKIELIINKIKKDIIDFKTREIVSKETKNIREMLVAKAFANRDEFDEIPPGNVDDPVGFKPDQF